VESKVVEDKITTDNFTQRIITVPTGVILHSTANWRVQGKTIKIVLAFYNRSKIQFTFREPSSQKPPSTRLPLPVLLTSNPDIEKLHETLAKII
jgi:hypothetical protein